MSEPISDENLDPSRNSTRIPGSSPSKKGTTLSDSTWVELAQASKTIEDMERKIKKLQSVASQGLGQQKGFLSSAQVKMVMEMLDEIEGGYEKHYRELERLQEEYNKKSQKMHEDIMKSQELLTYAEGGADGMGDRLAEHEVERRRQKRDTLIEEKERFEKESQPELAAIRSSIEKLEQRKDLSHSIYNEDIGQLHEDDGSKRRIERDMYSAIGASGTVMSVGSLLGFISSGYNKLTEQQWNASDLGQKLGYYEGDDRSLRKDLTKLGRENDYDTKSTIETGMLLARGGVTDKEGYEKDITTAQEMGRAFSIDPNQMADMGAFMKQVEALEDGQMQRLANLIGNSINKNGMKGREEEQIRSTQQIVETLTSNLNEVDFSHVQNIVGLQDIVSQSSAKLKGDGGAQAIQNMDSSIKNGNNIMDILMGYGTDPRYQGIEGRLRLEYDKEKGASDPENIKRILQNASKYSDDPSYRALMLKSLGFAELHDLEALQDSGALDKMKHGEYINSDILDMMDEEGSDTVKESLRKYNESFTSKTRGNRVDRENLQTYMASGIQGIWENGKDIFYSQPQLLQGLEVGLGLGGVRLARKFVPKVAKKIHNMGGNILKKYGARGAESAVDVADEVVEGASMMSKVKDAGRGAISYVEEGASTLHSTLDDVVQGAASSIDDVGKGALSGVGKAVGKLGAKAIPIAGMAIDAGLNMAEGDSFGKSVTKAGLTGALALGAGALLAPVTGGLSLGAGLAVAGGVGIGSSMISDKVVDSFWKEDDKETPVEKTRKLDPTTDNGKYKEISEGLDKDLSSVEGNYNINVTISGSVEGMSPTNQTEVTNSVSDFFKDLLSGGNRSAGTINLSNSWSRG